MKLQICINQQEAIRRGIDAPRSTAKVEVNPADLSQAERDWIARNLYEGYRLDYYGSVKAVSPTIDGLRGMIADELIAAAADEANMEARERERVEHLLQKLTNRETMQAGQYVTASGRARNVCYTFDYFHWADSLTPEQIDSVPGAAAWLASLKEAEAKAKAEAEAEARRREQACEAEDREKAAKEAARIAFIAEWVNTHGTSNQRGRLAAGLLPEDEIIASMIASVFAANLPEYVPMKKDDIKCAEECCGECTASFETDACGSATAEQWEVMQQLQAAYPAASVTLELHSGTKSCGGELARFSVRVKLPFGPLTLRRDYQGSHDL